MRVASLSQYAMTKLILTYALCITAAICLPLLCVLSFADKSADPFLPALPQPIEAVPYMIGQPMSTAIPASAADDAYAYPGDYPSADALSVTPPPIVLPTDIRVLQNGSVEVVPLEQYVMHTLAAEMPSSFHPEALRAQAVAIRTYAVYYTLHPAHDNADVCGDYRHCAAYSVDEPSVAVETAVWDTAGRILEYGGEPICAVFHAASSGVTRNSGDVWGKALPYLTAVPSPEEPPVQRYTFTWEELSALLGDGELIFRFENVENTVASGARTDVNAVEGITVGGVYIDRNVLRDKLGLASSIFTADIGESVTFTTYGSGHGVGLSQYGADALARMGYGYDAVLRHYYTGAVLR